MKMKWIISTTILGCLTLAGCEFSNKEQNTYYFPIEIRETTGNSTLITNQQWSDDGLLKRANQMLNGIMLYEDYKIDYDNKKYTATRYRIHYDQYGNEVSEQKRVSYYMTDWQTEYKFEAFDLGTGGDDAVPAESWEEKYGSDDRPIGFVRKIDGVVVEERSNFTYTGTSGSNIQTQTYTLKEGGVETIIHKETSGAGIMTYADWNSKTRTGTLIEKRDGYIVSPQTYQLTSYIVTAYDKNGESEVKTTVTIEYTSKTVIE